MDALVGVKVDKRWVTELMDYWERLPDALQHTLIDRYTAMVGGTAAAGEDHMKIDEEVEDEEAEVDAVQSLPKKRKTSSAAWAHLHHHFLFS